MSRYAKYAWGLVAYNLFVILWGALVRATHSGAGCGSHWPTCNGQFIPLAAPVETMIEFTHRMTSMVDGFLVIALVWGAFRFLPRGNPTRGAAVASLLIILIEGWLGRQLVVNELVAYNDSVERAIWIALHLLNTLLLLAALSLTAWFASGQPRAHLRGNGATAALWLLALLALMIVGASGAVTALGDTLFPAGTLAEGVRQELSPTAHFLLRLRVIHPLLAVGAGLVVVLLAQAIRLRHRSALSQRLATGMLWLYGLQLLGGLLNVALLAPVWMQLVHLLLADLLWISLLLLGMAALAMPHGAATQPRPVSPSLSPAAD